MGRSKPKPKKDQESKEKFPNMVAVRLEAGHYTALKELAAADPELMVTPSVLIRRAIRQYLQQQGKLKSE